MVGITSAWPIASTWSRLLRAPLQMAVRGYRTRTFTPKMGRNHYKGYGARTFGRKTTKGAFRLLRRPQYHVADLSDFKLKPYVSHGTWSGWAKRKDD